MDSDVILKRCLATDRRKWNKPEWRSVFNSHKPTIREVVVCLGLEIVPTSKNRGDSSFNNMNYYTMKQNVMNLSKSLPIEREALLESDVTFVELDKDISA